MREGKVEGSGVGDGDTVEVITAGLTQSVPLRLILVNSTEAMGGSGHPETKCGRGELGALEAYWFLNDLTEMHGEIVRARYYRSDAYGRPIVHLFAETKRGIWLDLNRAMVESGHAHVFYVAPNITGKLVRFLGIQQEAQAKGIGIWQYPHYRRGLHITSIRTFTKDAEAHPHLEFVRVANLHSDRAIQLEGIQIHNGSMRGMLPNLLLQPGHVVKVLLCGGKYNDNTNQELVITVREAKKNKGHPLLDSKQPVELLEPGPNGKPISIHIPGSEANQLVPPEFRHEREAGLHLMALNPLQHIKGFHDLKENVRLYNHSEAEVDRSGWTVKQGEKIPGDPALYLSRADRF
ncbi:MAG: thermonuclease family protein [Deltaproteobacteria bacterium]|nr:thermonuclease family protein [Deltaproteobacteria bacterium]